MRQIVKALLIAALTVAGWLALVRHAERAGGEVGGCRVSYVYDGDTVALTCVTGPEFTARVQGLDAPETKEPRCAAELAHGTLATERLRMLVSGGEVGIRRMGRDKYGRVLIRLSVDGVDVAETLVREGLAVAYRGGQRIDWCARLGGG